MSLQLDMNGKVAVVTGAASGLGRAAALRLAEAGAKLCLVDVHEERLNETGAMLSALFGYWAFFSPCYRTMRASSA